ncbi:MAG: toxins and related Ca2+-binding domain, partial [Verrucomicrobiota bacterium]
STNATLDYATDGADFTNAITAGSGVVFTLASDVKTGSAGINHNIGTVSIGSGAPALQMNITRGPNVSSGNPRITTSTLTLSGGSGGTTIINPTTADITIPSITSVSSSKTLQLDGTSTGNQITGVIGNGANLVSLVKSGASTWTLSGANTYTGNTTVSNGSLALTGSGAILSTNITVVSGGTLDVSGVSFTLGAFQTLSGNGTINGNVTTTAGSQLLPGGAASVGKLTINNTLTLVGGETVKFDFASGTNDSVAVGTLTPTGTTTINLASLPPGGLTSGTYTLFTANTLNGSAANFTVSGAPSPSRQTFTVTYDTASSPKRVLLTVAGSAANLLWTGVAPAWDINTSFNWTNTLAGTNDIFLDGDNVSFTDLGLATSPVLNVTASPSSATFNSTGSYTLSGTGKISGAGSLTHSGSGTTTILTTNNYTGVSALNAGTVVVDSLPNGGVAGPLGASPSASANLSFNGGALRFTGASSSTDRGATLNAGGATVDVSSGASVVTVSGTVVGAGGITKVGNGTLTLSGVNTYSGPTAVSVGVLSNASATAIGDLSAVSLADSATVALNLGATEGIGSLAGGGVNGGNVNLGANRLYIGANNASTTYGGIITGTGGINKVGTGALTLNTAHTFTGNVFGNRGTLVLDNGASLNLTTWVSIGQDTNDNATLTMQGNSTLTTTSDLNAGDLGASVGTINVQDNATVTANGLFVGSANAAGSTASGTINQTGGSVTEQNTGVGFFSIGGRGPSASGVGVYNISGGTLTAAAGIRVGSQGTGTLNVSGTATVNANGGFNTARLTGSTGTANFNGGTVNTLNFASSTGVNATNNFNGSTVKPTVASTTWLQGLTRANIRNGGLILDDNSLNLTINQALLHSDITGDAATDGGLNKSGGGTLTLTAANTYTGPTVINGGTLVLTGSLGTGAVTNVSGATLTGNGIIKGPTDVQGTINPGNPNGVLTISNSLSFETGATANFTFAPGTNTTITATGALNVNGATSVTLDFNNAVPPVGYTTLIRYGTTASGVANLTVTTSNPRYTFGLTNDTAAKAVKLVVTGVPHALTWLGDGVNNYWDNVGSYSNWLSGASLDYFYDGDNVTFSTGSNTPAINLLNDMTAGSVTVNATKDFEFAGTGPLGASSGLTKSGSGTLILSVSNTYAGPAVINAGSVQVGNGSTTGTLSASAVTNNSALVFNHSDTVGMNSEITGSGSLSQISAGGVQLGGSNSYTGLTLVTNGFVFPRNPLAFGSTATGTVATNAGQIYIDQNIDVAAEPLTLGGAALRKGGGGVSALGGGITLVANSIFNVDGGATLNLTNAAGVSGSGNSLELTGPGNGSTAGPTSLGTGGITKTGSGTWTLGANNNYTGLTTLSAGTLRIVDTTVGNPASFTANQVTLGGGTLTATTNISFVGGNVGFSVTGTTGGFGVESGATLVISNDISGSGTLAKSGPGTLVLAGPNTFSGTLRVDSTSTTANDGALRITTSNAIASAASPIYSGNNNGGSSTLQLDGTAGPIGIIQGFIASCRNSGVAWINNLAGTNSLLGVVQVEVGGGTLPFQSDAGLLTVANNIQYIGGSTNGRTYQFGGTGDTLVSGVILNGDNTAPVSVSKVGSGTVTLSAANTYTNSTTVNAGTLLITGSISSTGAVSVVGGVLGGTGSINDNVTVGAGGTLAPGVGGIGTLAINGNLSIAGGLNIDVNKSVSPTNDYITVSGTLANSGTGLVNVSNLGPALAAGNSFKLFSAPVTGGGALIITNGLGAGLAWTNRLAVDGSIAVIAVASGPATNPTNITSSVTGGTTLNLSWPADHLGWVLQTQTNSRSVGLKPQTNQWFDVAGSTTITNTSYPLDKTQPTIFFRLRSP